MIFVPIKTPQGTKQNKDWVERRRWRCVRKVWLAGGGGGAHSTILKFPMHSISVRNLMVVFTFSP